MPYDPSTAAGGAATAAPSGATDVYGLSPSEEQWTFFNGYAPVNMNQSQREAQLRLKHANPNDGVEVGQARLSASSAKDIMRQLAALASGTPEQRAAFENFQYQMLAARFYNSTSTTRLPFVPGHWTDDDAKAILAAMRSYQQVAGPDGAQQPITFSEYIDQASKAAAAAPGAGATKNPGPLLTDPNQLRMYAQKAAQAALGRDLSESEMNNFISQFHTEQTNAYTEAAKPGMQMVDKSDPRAGAIAYVTQGHQDEFNQHALQGYTDAFLNMFLNGSSSAPNVNVDAAAGVY